MEVMRRSGIMYKIGRYRQQDFDRLDAGGEGVKGIKVDSINLA